MFLAVVSKPWNLMNYTIIKTPQATGEDWQCKNIWKPLLWQDCSSIKCVIKYQDEVPNLSSDIKNVDEKSNETDTDDEKTENTCFWRPTSFFCSLSFYYIYN
jgi:hypothetical protein